MTNQITPGYLVECFSPEGPRTEYTFFTNPMLITARRSAITHLEALLTSFWQQDDDTIDIRVSLIEVDPTQPMDTAQFIATVYERKLADFPRPTGDLPLCAQNALIYLEHEYQYYLANQRHMGTGFHCVQVYGEKDNALQNATNVLSDAMPYAMEIQHLTSAYTLPDWYTITPFFPMRSLLTPQSPIH
jgi:hypothetical protein